MNVLNVIYKDITVNINHSTINIYEDYIQIFFVRTQDNDCKFFCQWLDANRIDYEKKERDSYTIIKVDTNIFNLDIAVKSPIKSSEIYNNFYGFHSRFYIFLLLLFSGIYYNVMIPESKVRKPMQACLRECKHVAIWYQRGII